MRKEEDPDQENEMKAELLSLRETLSRVKHQSRSTTMTRISLQGERRRTRRTRRRRKTRKIRKTRRQKRTRRRKRRRICLVNSVILLQRMVGLTSLQVSKKKVRFKSEHCYTLIFN